MSALRAEAPYTRPIRRRAWYHRLALRILGSEIASVNLVLTGLLYFVLRVVWDIPGEPAGRLRDGLCFGLLILVLGVATVLVVGAIVLTRPKGSE